MAKRKRKAKTSNNGAPRRYSYAFLTMGGRRFVQLTEERFNRLYQREQENILKTAKYTGEDIRKITKEDWLTLNAQGKIGEKAYKRAVDIAKGIVTASAEDIIISNYKVGIETMGDTDLAKRFEDIAKYLKRSDSAKFEMFMKEIPDLFLFYKDKGQSHTKRQKTFNQELAEDEIAELELIIEEYEQEIEEESEEGEDDEEQ